MEFYTQIGLTPTGYRQSIEKQSLKVDTLEKIARYFDKSISWFFEEYSSNDAGAILNEAEAEHRGTYFKEKYYYALEQLMKH